MTVHVVGAGLAGLSAALAAARAGHRVVVHEASATAGGRCRSFFDPTLDCEIDNGTHVLLGANKAALGFLDYIGASRAMVSVTTGEVPFYDLGKEERWAIDVASRPLAGLIKFLRGKKYLLPLIRLGLMGFSEKNRKVETASPTGTELYTQLIDPLCTAIMNSPPRQASARGFGRVLWALGLGGRNALMPYIAETTLAAALIDPALSAIRKLGGEILFHDPLLRMAARPMDNPKDLMIGAAEFRSGVLTVGSDDSLIMAVPPWALTILPEDESPPLFRTHAILCAHYAIDLRDKMPDATRMMGAIGGLAQWFAVGDGIFSITVSAADAWMDKPAGPTAWYLWREACKALSLGDMPVPEHKVIKERRATVEIDGGFGPGSPFLNLFYAGGWTDSIRPDTIEAAILSGRRAARCLKKAR